MLVNVAPFGVSLLAKKNLRGLRNALTFLIVTMQIQKNLSEYSIFECGVRWVNDSFDLESENRVFLHELVQVRSCSTIFAGVARINRKHIIRAHFRDNIQNFFFWNCVFRFGFFMFSATVVVHVDGCCSSGCGCGQFATTKPNLPLRRQSPAHKPNKPTSIAAMVTIPSKMRCN